MPAERDVTCPHCGKVRTTKADRNVRVKCPSCSGSFRVPEPDAAAVAHPPTPIDLGRLDPARRNSSGVVVDVATGVKIKPARTTTKTAPASTRPAATAAPPAVDVDDEPAVTPSADPAAPDRQADFKHFGQRGGLSRYGRTRGTR